jgi:fibronectin-binding autotransporter adhesin
MATIKITELTSIGANLTSSTVIPVVNMSGTPTTEKTLLGNIANVVLAGAGGNYTAAAVSILAQAVTNAAQPNITSTGTLTNLTVSGNVTVNGNITSNSTAYVGNLSTTGLASITTLSVGATANLGAVGNVTITGGTAGQVLTTNGSNVLSWSTVTAGALSGDGGNISNIAGANVSGFVPNANIANTAFAVAAANVSGLGNIATINLDGNVSNLLTGNGTYVAIPVVPSVGNIATLNLDGNASNVLRGDGTFGADANSSYGDSNVTSLLGAFGSNTIVTTGIITADGANLSNVPYANLTGAPSLGNISNINLDGNVSNLLTGNGTYVAIPVVPTVGNIATLNLDGNSQTWLAGNGVFANIAIPSVGNIATLNLDGNASNVLRGDGTFGADANSSYGDSNVTSLLGAFGSNTISTTGIITADGANLSNVPYANLTGAPSLGNIATLNLDGNVSNLLTGNGTYVAIPTVPTVGNIATLNLDGNVSNVLTGNGTFVALPVINANTVIWSTAPVANTSNGTAGQAAYDSGGNLYVCVATDTWSKFTGNITW